MAAIDPLIVKLIADNRDFNDNMAKSQRIADTRLSAIEARGAKMGKGLSTGFSLAKTAALGFVASIGIDTITRAIGAGLQYAASLGEVAQQLGVTTDALQEYRYAGSQAGLATEEIDMALSQLTRRIGEGVNGTKAQADTFEKLGVSLKDAKGNVIATGDAIPLIADALKKIKSPAEQSALLLDLFGKSGQKLLPLLSQGASGVNNLRDAAQKLGLVLSSEQIAKADETADKLDALKQVLAAKIAGTVADNADSILSLANALANLVGSIGGAIKAYKQLREQFAIGVQAGIGAGLPGAIGTQFLASAAQRRAKAQSEGARGKFSDLGLPSRNAQTSRSNFAAQSDPFGDFRAAIAPVGSSSVAAAKKTGAALTSSQSELLALNVELFNLVAELLDTTEARVEAEKFAIEAEKAQAISRIQSNTDLTAKQKELDILGQEQLAAGRIELAGKKLDADNAEKERIANRELADIAEAQSRNAIDALESEYDLATSNKERARIAAQIVETETKAALDAIDRQLLDQDISEAKRQQLQAIRAGIVAEGVSAQRKAAEGNQGAAETELDRLNKLNFGDESEKFGVDALKDLNRGLADAIVNGGNLGDVLEDTGKRFIAQLIQMAFQLLVIKPLLESLKNIGTDGGPTDIISAFLGAFGGAQPRASGGPVQGGRMYRINESQKEFFRPNVGGDIIPLSRMNVAQSGGGSGGVSVIRLELSGDIDARIQSQSASVAVEVVRASAPSIVDAGANEALRRSGRPRL